MNNRHANASFLSILLLFLFVKSVCAADGLIQKVEYVNSGEELESVAFHLNGAYLPKVFAIKGDSPRVVFDFFETLLDKKSPTAIAANGKVVKKIRLGRHGDRTRVVIDLNSSTGYRFDQKFDDVNNILTILLFSDAVPEKPAAEEVTLEPAEVPESILVVDSIPAREEVFPGSSAKSSVAAEEEATPAVTGKQEEPEKVEVVAASVTEPVAADTGASQEEALAETPAGEQKAATSFSAEPLLSDISFENTSNNGEMVLFKLNGFFPPTVAGEEAGTPQVVCKFPGTRLSGTVVKDQESQGRFVDRIRVVQSADKNQLEVILELVPNKNYDLQQVFFKEDNLFVVIVNSYDEQDSAAAKETVKQ